MEVLLPGRCEGLQHMSESVFVVLSEIVGTSQQVAIRRETVDIREMVKRRASPYNTIIRMVSGSMREGFRLNGSDIDAMYWPNNHRVIMDISQSEYYNAPNTTLIFSDSSESPPGFTLLQLLTLSNDIDVCSPICVRINDGLYISSSVYRMAIWAGVYPNSTLHGPCSSGFILGALEYDSAWCFGSDFWPPSAISWIDRCHSWPDPEVVDDIVRNGCHFVAIGHPLGSHVHNEWRISFSQAEQKCVSAMNHSQFLTYGLLKLFLKEVIKQQSAKADKLLCSYHMKTTILWVIQQNTLPHWCPQNILTGFWICFKLLLKWVYEGICPNFFIPENNLFLTKVRGSAQNRLFRQLHELYKKGLACLLQSSSIRSYIVDVLYDPRSFICTDERIIISKFDHDVELFNELNRSDYDLHANNLKSYVKLLNAVECLIGLPLKEYQGVMLQKMTASINQRIAFVLLNMFTKTSVNKQVYIVHKIAREMLKLSAKFGFVSDMLYIAIYYYKSLRYSEALSIIRMTKVKLTRPYLIIMYREEVHREMYTEAVGGQSWYTKMRQAVSGDIVLDNRLCYISDLIPEQQSALQRRLSVLSIPVFVMLHFLEFLCYRHIDTTLSQAALDELQVLVHHDQGLYVRDLYRDISWEVLGICQQITANPHAALYSYIQSLFSQFQTSMIQTATLGRVRSVVQSTLH